LLSDSSRATTSSSAALPPRSRAEAAGQDLGALLASLVRSLPVIGVDKVRSIHWSPYDPVRVVNADP
jgi:hypothetical protein